MATVFYIHYIYKNSDEDDILRVQRTDDGEFLVTMRFRDNIEKKVMYEAYMSKRQILDLVSNTLKSITYDKEPVESVQVFTMLAPSIMYASEDLYDRNIRELIVDTLHLALLVEVDKTNYNQGA